LVSISVSRTKPRSRSLSPTKRQASSTYVYIRLSLRSTAKPIYFKFPNTFGRRFSKVTIGYSPNIALCAGVHLNVLSNSYDRMYL
jgi:hypothetical protein